MRISSFLKKKFLKSLFFPSHNRGDALPENIIKLLKEKPGSWDLPELPEIGSPLSNKGLISDAQKFISKQFDVKRCWFGVNGASGLMQSAIIAMANPGDYLLMPRNIHICVIKICALANITPVFFDLEVSEITGHYLPITSSWFKNVLENKLIRNIKISGVVLVNPYYQGYSTEINELIEICHKNEMPVLVDEAHGAYFLFCEDFGLPKSAVRSNADLVVHSLHKSLNGLTQTAVMWHSGNIIDENDISNSINLLQTTSPNSLLLSSCEESIRDWLILDNLKKYKERISEARRIFKELKKKGLPLITTQDPLKIVLNTGIYGIDGFTADQFFYQNGIIAELPEMMTLTFCLGFSKQDQFIAIFSKLWNKLINFKQLRTNLKVIKTPFQFIQLPEVSPAKAIRAKSYKMPLHKSIGKVSAEIICPYPPGIPLIIPGERIDKARVDWISEQSLYYKELVNSYISVLEP